MWIIDTDVVVAAIRSRAGASAELIRLALRDELEIGLSVALALEYEAVVTRPEHLEAGGLSVAQALTVVDALIAAAVPLRTHFQWRPQLRDPDDELVLEAAVNGNADAIVTFNRRDFTVASSKFGIEVLLPKQALEKTR